MPGTQRNCVYRGLTLNVYLHYIGSVTATTHQENGIITLELNPSRKLYYQVHTAKGTSVFNTGYGVNAGVREWNLPVLYLVYSIQVMASVLVLGSGGREHVLSWKLIQSQKVRRVYVAPGNAGTSGQSKTENVGKACVILYKFS